MGWVFNANFLEEQCGSGSRGRLNGEQRNNGCTWRCGQPEPHGRSAPHICSHNARSPARNRSGPSLLILILPSARVTDTSVPFQGCFWFFFLVFLHRIPPASRRHRQGEEGKLTLGFEDLQVLVLLNGVLATCDCPPSIPPHRSCCRHQRWERESRGREHAEEIQYGLF